MDGFTRVTMSELRAGLPKLRRQVQFDDRRFVCTHYGEVAAFLVQTGDFGVEKSLDVPLTEFRDRLTDYWEELLGGVECIYLTFHGRRVAAFVSPSVTVSVFAAGLHRQASPT